MASTVAISVLRGGIAGDSLRELKDDFEWDEEERDDEEPECVDDLADVVGKGFECDIGGEFEGDEFDGKDVDFKLVVVVVGKAGRVDREFNVEEGEVVDSDAKGDGWH